MYNIRYIFFILKFNIKNCHSVSQSVNSVAQSCRTLCDPMKGGLPVHHQLPEFMANRRGKDGSSDKFPLLGLQITADCDCSQEIRRRLLFGMKAMTNLDSMLKSKNITLLIKVYIVKAMVFPLVMHGCDSWTVKKAECQIIDDFELWCWRRLLKIPWTARRSS